MVQMSAAEKQSEKETMQQRSVSSSCPLKKRKGSRDLEAVPTADALSQFSNVSNGKNKKKQKKDADQEDVGSPGLPASKPLNDEESAALGSDKAKVVLPFRSEEIIRDDSESKKSKDNMSMDDFIDIEKAQYTFPERLFELLENGTVKKAMWWLPGGEAFALVPNSFYDTVLSKYFQGTKFESFTRKLNRWGFKRLSGQGVPKGTIAYYHKMFKNDKPDLMKKMRSGKSQNDAPEDRTVRGGLDDVFIPPSSMDTSNAARMQPYMQQHPDAASALLAQQASLMSQGGAMGPEHALKLQLLAQQQMVPSPSSLATARHIMAQEQRANALAQMQSAQSSSSELSLRRQAEMLAMEEIRAAQAHEQALLQAQWRARLMQHHAGMAGAGGAHGVGDIQGHHAGNAAAVTDEQIRMLLLRRQLQGRPNGGW